MSKEVSTSQESHTIVTTLLIPFITGLCFTFQEEDRIIEEWNPEPLVTAMPQDHPALKPHVVTGKVLTMLLLAINIPFIGQRFI